MERALGTSQEGAGAIAEGGAKERTVPDALEHAPSVEAARAFPHLPEVHGIDALVVEVVGLSLDPPRVELADGQKVVPTLTLVREDELPIIATQEESVVMLPQGWRELHGGSSVAELLEHVIHELP